jgi:hypothetical protein
VQFQASSPELASPYAGRVEHLESGRAVRFHSLEELLAFIARVLADLLGQPDKL